MLVDYKLKHSHIINLAFIRSCVFLYLFPFSAIMFLFPFLSEVMLRISKNSECINFYAHKSVI